MYSLPLRSLQWDFQVFDVKGRGSLPAADLLRLLFVSQHDVFCARKWHEMLRKHSAGHEFTLLDAEQCLLDMLLSPNRGPMSDEQMQAEAARLAIAYVEDKAPACAAERRQRETLHPPTPKQPVSFAPLLASVAESSYENVAAALLRFSVRHSFVID